MSEATEVKSAGEKKSKREVKKMSRKTLRDAGRVKRQKRLAEDTEFRAAWFDGKSKRSAAKKAAFRKRHAKA